MKNKILLITSGSYVNSELAADFGSIPNSFLPIGHKRLVELQVELIKNFSGNKYLSIPFKFPIRLSERNFLKKNNIKLFRSDPKISLIESILIFLDSINISNNDEFYIIHGDTLYSEIVFKPDMLYYNYTETYYKWGMVHDLNEDLENKNLIISGFFSFSNIQLFKKILQNSKDFVSSLINYNKEIEFKLEKGKDWLDFGHSNLYYKSKVKLNVSRFFNTTMWNENFIVKTSSNKVKIFNEFNWFKNLPDELIYYTPRVWGFSEIDSVSSYNIEFVAAPTLQEIFVFGNLPKENLKFIIDKVFKLISKMSCIKFPMSSEFIKKNLNEIYINKTNRRLSEFIKNMNFDQYTPILINGQEYPSLSDFKKIIFGILQKRIDSMAMNKSLTVMHGDLCFSNILIQNRSNSIKIIDPRGNMFDDGNKNDNIIGDFFYDISKLGHSLIGNYDNIVTGYYNLNFDLKSNQYMLEFENKEQYEFHKYFYNKVYTFNVTQAEIKASISNLFLSMLPLHNENKNRQIAFLINSYKVFYEL